MSVHVSDHPLVGVRLTELRDERTGAPRFRALLDDLATLLLPEVTRGLRTAPTTVRTPLAAAAGTTLVDPPLLVPVLRAGLGLLPALSRALPESPVAMVGLRRDEESLQPAWYLDGLPADLTGRPAVVADPMLATGGTLVAVLAELRRRRSGPVTVVAVLATPVGLAAVDGPDVRVVVAGVDERLTDAGWIWPGLGDAGDRQTGA